MDAAANITSEILTPRTRLRPVDEYVIFFTIAFCTEGSLALFIFRGAIDAYLFLILHIISVSLLTGWMISLRNRGLDYGIVGLMTFSTLTLGFIGVLGASLTMVYLLIHKEDKGFDNESFHVLPKGHQAIRSRDLYNNIVSGRESFATTTSVSSFIDIMSYGSHEQKQALIALLARHYKPQFAPALRCALVDSSSDIRVQAATAVAKIEQAYSAKWAILKARTDRKENRFESYYALACHLDDYAFLGLLDEERKSVIQDRALECYQQCQKLATSNTDLSIAMGRLLVRRDQISEAIKIFESINPASFSVAGVFWYGQCLFIQKRYSDLRQLLAEWESISQQDSSDLPEKLHGVFGLWRKGLST
jgi:hypothetical protein